MANKRIINSAPPKPSKRIIGGSNQRSKARLNLQASYSWRYNHAPENLDEAQNANWWRVRAERFIAPLSSSGDILYGRQSVKRELGRQVDRQRIYDINAEVDNTIKGGSNQPINKKYHLGNKTFTAFDQEIDISDDIYPNTKKRVSFGVTIDGKTYNSEEVVPFSLFSSSVTDGYQATLAANGFGNVDFANLHDDKIQSYQGEVPLQGPFTEGFVGGILARHNAPLRTTERQESFNIVLSPASPATAILTVDNGADPFLDLDGKILTLTLGGVSYSATFNDGVDIADSSKTVLGVADALDADGAAEAIVVSLNAAASGDSLPLGAVIGSGVGLGGNQVLITGTFSGTRDNGTAFAGNAVASGLITPTPTFAGGSATTRTMNEPTVGNPQGKYLRGLGPKAPVNIENIKTLFTSDSVRVVGNYIKNYEVVQGANRIATNMDLAFNTENYDYSLPSAFITPPARRTLGLTGSADYPAPRQIPSRRTNDTIFVNKFSSPGGKNVSKQQFRDVASDQFSPNSALPFRNLSVISPYLKKLGTHTLFGGIQSGSTSIAAVYKVQRNETQRIVSDENTFVTGNLFDTFFFNRPIPAGDSTQWFFATSGSNTTTFSDYVLSGSRYPSSIALTKTNLTTGGDGINAGTGDYTWIDGNSYYIWSRDPYSAPWSQLSISYKNGSRYLRNNNLFELLPDESSIFNGVRFADTTQSRSFSDQGGNVITNFFSQQLKEPPITSRYKPLVHQIETFIGSPTETTTNKITLNLEYSYGNSLMGFANRELNRQLAGDIKFDYNKIKRPYEALREQTNSDLNRSLNGVNMIKMFAYNETIFPKEINTYVSGSRARLSFKNSYWRDDASTLSTVYTYENFNTLFYNTQVIAEENRQLPRIVTPFTTSQGYVVQRGEQLPYNSSNPSYQKATGPGKASMWPMDSFLYSDDIANYTTVLTGAFTASILLADAATTECGELMMTHFGTVNDKMTDFDTTFNTQSFSTYDTANIVSSQYVYSIGFVTGNVAVASKPNFGTASVEPLIPGGAYSRPPWTAGSQRLFVDGENKGTLNNPVYPFYNSYEDWVSELRLVGKAHTIVPEYRVSEHINEFKTNRTIFTAISSSLEITGANDNNFNGTNTNFYTRYATTDNMEFLSDFMTYDKGDVNYIFNKFPRHLEVSSDAIIKLLPYEGFYPVNRTLEIATLFSQSYSAAAQFTGSEAGQHSQWRALLRPYFAPGIMYNSIKSGVAVDYPIRRSNKNGSAYDEKQAILFDPVNPGYKIGHPLFGGLYGAITGDANVSGTIPGHSRRNRENFDWEDPDVNAMFWADRLPFESILAPEDYLTADLDTTTGSLATVMSDINFLLHLDVTASFAEGQIDSNNLYKKAVSNFIANVPKFFLKTKDNRFGSPGKLTKFVSQFGNPSKGSQEVTTAARTVTVDPKNAYMMEIGLMKTEQFNLYSNPAAFGPATNTSFYLQPWEIAAASGSWTPSGSAWPKHRGEFAPFTPPYYYGPSLARITFMPIGDKTEYTLNEIIENDRGEVFVDYINESGSYYDATSGSFVNSYGQTVQTNTTPAYKWNRAWINRMDIDASINIGNEFPTSAGSFYKSSDPNKWTIMPKWESPILDFPNIVRTPAADAIPAVAASASITVTNAASATNGQTIVITTNTTAVTFEFNSSTEVPARIDANNYEIGIKSLGASDAVLAARIVDSINDCAAAGEIDVSIGTLALPSFPIISLVPGTAMNGEVIGGTAKSANIITTTAFAGGVDASPATPATTTVGYDFSSSVNAGEFSGSTSGMWHQYGTTPNNGEGVYMYIKDIPTGEDEEYDLVANLNFVGGFVGTVGSYQYVRKVPKFVIDSQRTVTSLADLCGFDSNEIIRKGFDTTKAKRLGELAEDNENSMSEAILALPFYIDDDGTPKLITLQASPAELGPKIKEFRKRFTKYSLPPVLASKLMGLVPKGYPAISDVINPFGGDEYDKILAGEDINQIPVVYMMEHKATFSKQDLADMWQGIMPDLSRKMSFSFSAIDHYMPGDNVEENTVRFPEVLKEQINLGVARDGNPRYDLLDIAEKSCKQGFFPDIKWLVFKVKERGIPTYEQMIMQEVDGPNAMGYDNSKEFLTLQGLPSDQVERILGDRDEFAKSVYTRKHSLDSPTYNWPYDYCSLIESVKINSKVGFRPDLEKEYEEEVNSVTNQNADNK